METKLIKKLVEIKSISGDKAKCLKALDIVKKEILKHHIPCQIRDHNDTPFLLAGKISNGSILFLNHIDVVPAETEQFKVKQKGNKLFGRGVLDMKGPLVACLDSFFQLWKTGNKKIIFAVTSDEEIGGFNGANFLSKAKFKNIKLAIIPDGSSDDLVIVQKAPFHIRILAKGKSAHGSKPWEGKNAAENLLKCCLQIIKNVNGVSHDQTSATITQFHSGETTNKVPDKAEAIIDIRIEKESEVEELINKIRGITKECRCDWEKIDEPLFFEIASDNFFIKKWQEIFKKITGEKISLKVECGASDARFLWKELRIPVIVTSVKGGGAHSNHEWADIDSLNKLSETIVKFVNSL